MLRAIAAIFFLIVGLIAFDISSSVYHPCESASEQQQEDESAKEGCGFASSASYRWTVVSVDWIDKRHDFVTAASTVVIALFTIILGVFTVSVANATKIAANAADLSARAAIALQLPIITINPDTITHGDHVVVGDPFEDCGVPFVIIGNRGATAAMPIEILYGYAVGERLPDTPSYQYLDPFSFDSIIDVPPKLSRQRLTHHCPLSPGEWSKICGGNSFWFYCLLRYEDFMEEKRSVSFCWRWCNTGEGLAWKAEKIPAYNRKT
jgi:hypothetical protein